MRSSHVICCICCISIVHLYLVNLTCCMFHLQDFCFTNLSFIQSRALTFLHAHNWHNTVPAKKKLLAPGCPLAIFHRTLRQWIATLKHNIWNIEINICNIAHHRLQYQKVCWKKLLTIRWWWGKNSPQHIFHIA